MDPNDNSAVYILIVSLLTGVSIGVLAWLVLKQLFKIKLERREVKVQLPLMFKLFLPFARPVSNLLRHRGFERARTTTDQRLVQAGLDQTIAPEEFLGLRLIYLIVFTVLGLFFLLMPAKVLHLLGMIFLIYGLVYPTLWLLSIIRQRHKSIQRALPNVLDLLTLSVEAGRDFLTALRDILQTRQKDPLGDELERVFREVQLGKQRRQALRNMADRVRQADLSTVVETLVQADELGVSIGHILRILSDQMRQKRFQNAEKLANESPTKLLFPLFVFIFPAVIIVMLGPILLRSLHSFL